MRLPRACAWRGGLRWSGRARGAPCPWCPTASTPRRQADGVLESRRARGGQGRGSPPTRATPAQRTEPMHTPRAAPRGASSACRPSAARAAWRPEPGGRIPNLARPVSAIPTRASFYCGARVPPPLPTRPASGARARRATPGGPPASPPAGCLLQTRPASRARARSAIPGGPAAPNPPPAAATRVGGPPRERHPGGHRPPPLPSRRDPRPRCAHAAAPRGIHAASLRLPPAAAPPAPCRLARVSCPRTQRHPGGTRRRLPLSSRPAVGARLCSGGPRGLPAAPRPVEPLPIGAAPCPPPPPEEHAARGGVGTEPEPEALGAQRAPEAWPPQPGTFAAATEQSLRHRQGPTPLPRSAWGAHPSRERTVRRCRPPPPRRTPRSSRCRWI